MKFCVCAWIFAAPREVCAFEASPPASNSAVVAVTMTTSFRMVFSLKLLIEENVNVVISSCDYYSKGTSQIREGSKGTSPLLRTTKGQQFGTSREGIEGPIATHSPCQRSAPTDVTADIWALRRDLGARASQHTEF